jgi:hypothetical protein
MKGETILAESLIAAGLLREARNNLSQNHRQKKPINTTKQSKYVFRKTKLVKLLRYSKLLGLQETIMRHTEIM